MRKTKAFGGLPAGWCMAVLARGWAGKSGLLWAGLTPSCPSAGPAATSLLKKSALEPENTAASPKLGNVGFKLQARWEKWFLGETGGLGVARLWLGRGVRTGRRKEAYDWTGGPTLIQYQILAWLCHKEAV